MVRSAACVVALSVCGAIGSEPGRVIVPRGTGWGNSAWPDNGAHDLASSAGYAHLEVDIYGEKSIDTSELKKYKDAGHLVFCYFSIGTLEEGRLDGQCKISGDKATCKKNQDLWRELTVKNMGDWPELWLDIENSKLRDVMGERIKMAKDAGCHGIEPDNIDCYDNKKCGKSKSAQKAFNKWTVDYAHSLGLSVCSKNVNAFMSDIDYDCAVVEQAFQYGDYKDWKSFAAKKAVFAIEYKSSYSCSKAEDNDMSLIYCAGSDGDCGSKTKMTHCRKDSSLPKIQCTSGSYDTKTKSCSGSSPTPSPTPSPSPAPKDWCTEGIYKLDKGVGVCCAKSCGQCGGTGCGSLPGGKWKCCADTLATDGDDCGVPEDTGCRIPSSTVVM